MNKKAKSTDKIQTKISFFMQLESKCAITPSVSENSTRDIEDLVRDPKKRKVDERKMLKKLHLTSSPKTVRQKRIYEKSETTAKCTPFLEGDDGTKENNSASINGCNSGKNLTSSEKHSLGSDEFLHVMFKPKIKKKPTRDLSSNEDSGAVHFQNEKSTSLELAENEVNEDSGNKKEELKIEANVICDVDIKAKTDSLVSASSGPECGKESTTSFDLNDIEFDDWDIESLTQEIGDLDLSEWQRCEVVKVNEELPGQKKTLQLRSIRSSAFSSCVLEGVWASSDIAPGSIVSVKAHCKNSSSGWAVDNDEGFFVEYPDLLISPTTIVGSVSCMRQGVLNYLFSKNGHVVDANSKLLASGCLIHELLQQVMVQGLNDPDCIATLVEEILYSSHNVKLLYSSAMSLEEARNELLKAIPYIQKVCKYYSIGDGDTPSSSQMSQNNNDIWEGKIHSIVAVEDNYWVPELGLKGKVDITVRAEERGQNQRQLMPVELKTGAAKNSIEHRGQVILYCLMAKQITPGVSGGLLLYLKEGFARKIDVGRPEQRDIITLRNALAHYLAPFFSSSKVKEITLPRPTNNSRVCEWCPQRNVCSAFLRASNDDESFKKSKAEELRSASIQHLTLEDVNYVVHWSNLIWLEEKDKSRDNLFDIWSLAAEKREAKGRCIANLKLSEPVRLKEVDSYIHIFKSSCQKKLNADNSCLASGCMVVLSTSCRVVIAFGIVLELNDFSVVIDVPRDLSQVSDLYGDTYMIDVYEPQSYLSWVLGNLAALLDDKESTSNLRRLLINDGRPVFDTSNSATNTNLDPLNECQQNAIKMACSAKDYFLLRGLPGTGKSTTVAVLIQQLVSQGHSVLLTAHTHSAVDTVLLKLLELKVSFLRIGFQGRVHEDLHPWTEASLTKSCYSPEQLDAVYNKQPVIAVTCLGVKHPLFTRRSFDVCVVDESTQIMQPIVLGPLLHAKKFVLVGDPEQLPPLVRSRAAREAGLAKCLFTHLDDRGATAVLDVQYRMNSKIMDLANELTYKGELKCASQAVAERTLQINTNKVPSSVPKWLLKALSGEIEDSVLFMDVPYTEVIVPDFTNKKEALVVKQLIELFLQVDVNPNCIGVIAPYTNQVKHLKSEMKSCPGIEINTVDQYQGRDKNIIIFSCTNNWSINSSSSSKSDICILNDTRRINVAITRAKNKLIIIGSLPAVQCFTPLKLIVNSIGCDNLIQVPDLSS